MGQQSNKLDAEEIFHVALQNAKNDRAMAQSLAVEYMKYLLQNEDRHQYGAPSFDKYAGIMQKSNEQIIKIGVELAKKTSYDPDEEDSSFGGPSDSIFDEIENTEIEDEDIDQFASTPDL